MAVAMMVDNPEGSQEIYERDPGAPRPGEACGRHLPRRRAQPHGRLARDRGLGVGRRGESVLPGAVRSRAPGPRAHRPAATASALARPQRDEVSRGRDEQTRIRALRHRDHRRRPGRPHGGVLPGEAGSLVRHPRRERADRRRLAQALGLAASLYAGVLQQAARHAAPGTRLVVSDEGRAGCLPGVVRGTLRASRANGHSASTGSPRSTAASSSLRASVASRRRT